jgi:hypothetical protein
MVHGPFFDGVDLAPAKLIAPIGLDRALNFDEANNRDRLIRDWPIKTFVRGGLIMMRWTLAAALSLASTGQLAAQGKGIRFWNLTTATVSSLRLSPAGKDSWGPNQTLNDKDKEVDHDERLRITGVEPGRYDAKISYRDKRQCLVRDIDIKADSVFSIADKDLNDCTK